MRKITLTPILALFLCATTFAQAPGEYEAAINVNAKNLRAIGDEAIAGRKLAEQREADAVAKLNAAELALSKATDDLTALKVEVDALRAQVVALNAELAKLRPGTQPAPAPYTVKLGGDIQAAINAATAGATVTVAPGTYKQSLIINKAVTVIGTGVTLDGGDSLPFALDVTAGTAKGFKVTRYSGDYESSNAAVRVRKGGTVDGLEIYANIATGIGFPAGSHGARLLNVHTHDNALSGFSGTQSSGVEIVNLRANGNNRGHAKFAGRNATEPTHWNANGSLNGWGYHFNKLSRNDGLTITNPTIAEDNGNSLWFDGGNQGYHVLGGVIGGKGLSLHLELGPPLGTRRSLVQGVRFNSKVSIGECRAVDLDGCTFAAGAILELRAMNGLTGGRPTKTYANTETHVVLGDINITRCIFEGGSAVNQVSTGSGSIRTSGTSAAEMLKTGVLTVKASGNVVK
jgi:hypothetical protein